MKLHKGKKSRFLLITYLSVSFLTACSPLDNDRGISLEKAISKSVKPSFVKEPIKKLTYVELNEYAIQYPESWQLEVIVESDRNPQKVVNLWKNKPPRETDSFPPNTARITLKIVNQKPNPIDSSIASIQTQKIAQCSINSSPESQENWKHPCLASPFPENKSIRLGLTNAKNRFVEITYWYGEGSDPSLIEEIQEIQASFDPF